MMITSKVNDKRPRLGNWLILEDRFATAGPRRRYEYRSSTAIIVTWGGRQSLRVMAPIYHISVLIFILQPMNLALNGSRLYLLESVYLGFINKNSSFGYSMTQSFRAMRTQLWLRRVGI